MKKLVISFVTLFLVVASCKKDDPTPTSNTTTNTEEIYYVKATIDDVSFEQKTNNPYYLTEFVQWNDFNSDSTLSPTFGSQIMVLTSEKKPQMEIYFKDNFLTHKQYYDTDTNFLNFFKIGNHPFKNPQNLYDFKVPGINISYIEYKDDQSTYWETEQGNQSESSFNVTEIKETKNIYNNLVLKVKGTFDCTLFNFNDTTITKKVKNGTFCLQYTKFE